MVEVSSTLASGFRQRFCSLREADKHSFWVAPLSLFLLLLDYSLEQLSRSGKMWE